MATGSTSILQKKLSKIKSRGYGFPVQSQIAARFERATAQGATKAVGATVEAIAEDTRVTRLDALIASLPSPGLFIELHTASGDRAVAGLDLALVDHLVELATGGDPSAADSLPSRMPTDLDVALCSMVIDAILRQFDHEIQALGSETETQPFVLGRVEHTPGNLGYLLPEQQYLGIRAALSTAGDARNGNLYVALPLSWIEPLEPALRRANPNAAQNDSAIWRRHMRSVVRRTPLKLTAVIDSFPMQVADMAHLETGALFPLPSISLDDVRLELDTGAESQVIARGRLGVHKSKKAIKIIEPLGNAYFEALADALSAD